MGYSIVKPTTTVDPGLALYHGTWPSIRVSSKSGNLKWTKLQSHRRIHFMSYRKLKWTRALDFIHARGLFFTNQIKMKSTTSQSVIIHFTTSSYTWLMSVGLVADAFVCEELSIKRFEALVYWNLEKEQCFPNVKQVRDCVQKLGISSLCVWLITIVIQREQDALQNN